MFNIAQGKDTVAEIARETDYARQSVQRLADVLVADGHATYTPDPDDRRRQIISLTAKGSALLADMEADFDRWSKGLVRTLGKERVINTIEDLHELKRVLDADAPQFDANHQERAR
jgi:DNA-binding MarR family transcriptional regulator